MKTISAALQAHYALAATTLTTCWKATLTNGTVVACTAHDVDLTIDGIAYLSTASYTASDVETTSEMNADNLEIDGFLRSPAITDSDIHSGVWDYAQIQIFIVNYKDLTMGNDYLRVGTLGEVKGGRTKFTAELRGLMQAYSRGMIKMTTKECTADLGDAKCKVNLAPLTIASSVQTVTSNSIITNTGLTQADDYFTAGKVTFTSGNNINLSMEVKKSLATGTITLHEQMPFQILVGDTFNIVAGCLKRRTEDCKTKFANVVNFRGFPDLPGSKIYNPGGIASQLGETTYTPLPAPSPAPSPSPSPTPTPTPPPAPGGSFPSILGANPANFGATPQMFDDFLGISLSGYWNKGIYYGSVPPSGTWRVLNGCLEMATVSSMPLSGNYTDYILFDTDPNSSKGATTPFSQKFGVFQAKIKLPIGKGYWPAFWLFNHIGVHRPEIDIMEAYAGAAGWSDGSTAPHPTRAASTVHPLDDPGGYQAPMITGNIASGVDLSADFHTYTCEWDSTFIKFYFDGALAQTITNVDTLAYINQFALYILINFGLGSIAGDRSTNTAVSPVGFGTDPTTPPANVMRVDYIAAWQYTKYGG